MPTIVVSKQRVDEGSGGGSAEEDQHADKQQNDDDRRDPPRFAFEQELDELAQKSGLLFLSGLGEADWCRFLANRFDAK